ncbi:MAG: flagellar biosynthesis anti-sigma factor FlgM [bacterium]
MKVYESEELKKLIRTHLIKETKDKTSFHYKTQDKLEISKEGEIFSRALKTISSIEEPDMEEKLASLRKAIETGSYKTDEKAIARSILSGDVPKDIIEKWVGE